MNWSRRIQHAIGGLFQKGKLDVDEEIRAHIELRTRADIEATMRGDEAGSAALTHLGWKELIQDACHDQRGTLGLRQPGEPAALAMPGAGGENRDLRRRGRWEWTPESEPMAALRKE